MTISSRKPKGSSHPKPTSKNFKTKSTNNSESNDSKNKNLIKYLLGTLTAVLIILQIFENIDTLPISRSNKAKLTSFRRSVIGFSPDSKIKFIPANSGKNENSKTSSGRVGVVEGTGYRFNMPAGVKTMEGRPGPVEKSVNSESLNQDEFGGAQKSSVFSNFGIGRSLESLISKQERAQAEISKKASGTVKRINSFLEGSEKQQPIQQITGSRNSRMNSASVASSPTDKGASAFFDPVLLYGPEPSVSKFSSGQGLVQKSVYTSEEVLLSNIDPQLGHLLHEMGSQSKGPGQGNYTWVADKDQCFSGDIVFAKTHKTGGTTVTNMLLRHAEKHQLSVGLPIEHRWELAGYRI